MLRLLDKVGDRLAPLFRNTDLMVVFGLFGVILLLLLPIPPFMLDLFLTLSIGISLLILLIVIYLKDPAEFSVFPTILLGVTLFRLGLNVASTRLILGSDEIPPDAGNVIQAFGDFVVRGDYVVGAVIFLILVVINFVVITKGAGRIAEVAARFTLDAMPGKQMAIDAELNAGLINERDATNRRMKIQKEADFYGSMDGASKFVRGDAVAGIIITAINVLGGIAIGVGKKDMPLVGGQGDPGALETYTLLTIGDGLVTQIPAIIVSVAAGILVTRSAEESNLGEHLSKQIIIYPKAVAVVSVMLLFFAIMPGMPIGPFLVLAGIAGFGAYLLKKNAPQLQAALAEKEAQGALPGGGQGALPGSQSPQLTDSKAEGPTVTEAEPQDIKSMIHVDTFAVEVGYGLIGMANKQQGGDLLERITGLRHKIARDLGMIIPPIAVRDNLELDNNEYTFRLRNKEIARSSLLPNRMMAMNVSGSSIQLKGVPTVEPVFKLDAVWIPEEETKNAEMNGYTVVTPADVLITHLSETLKDCAHLILEREDVQHLIDMIKEKNPTLINELLPDVVSVGLIQRVLQNLLKEKISIKNFTVILETIADYAQVTKSPDDLAEQVRRRLGVYFVSEYEFEPGKLQAITLEPRLEQTLIQRVKRTQFEVGLMIDPALTDHLLTQLQPAVESMVEQGVDPIILTTADMRLAFKRFFEPSFPRMVVLCYQEIPNEVQIQNVGVLTLPSGMQPQQPQPQEAQSEQ